jgi:hypothetical protein
VNDECELAQGKLLSTREPRSVDFVQADAFAGNCILYGPSKGSGETFGFRLESVHDIDGLMISKFPSSHHFRHDGTTSCASCRLRHIKNETGAY